MPTIKQLQAELAKAQAAKDAATTGQPSTTPTVSDEQLAVIVATVLSRMATGDVAWFRAINDGVQFAVRLPNGTVVNSYANAPGSTAAKGNLIPPSERVKREKAPKQVGSLI